MSNSVRRLFEQFQPENYNLSLDIDSEAMTFTGNVVITGKKVGRPSSRITLHQKGLIFTDATATIRRSDKKGDQLFEVVRINTQDSYDEVRLHTTEQLYPGDYTVMLSFKGTITRPMNGMYPAFFIQDGEEKKLIATQFESHHAREVFPCIDEPEAKATFDLVLATPVVKTVLANTPIEEQFVNSADKETSGKERLRTFFETTPRMSTYLLAFTFGEYDYLEATTKAGVTVRTYATPENAKHTAFALDVAVKCLDFYNEYFAIDYPLAKCDFIALPDFASGAMENWGCITFREQALLVDEQNTSLHMKQYVANVVAHELTHQWFGNLVTMQWWNDLWLNESFASLMSVQAVDHLFPEWNVWTQFITDDQAIAFKQDALEHTHPISTVINHPDEIRTIFDAISYDKGASVLYMLKNYLGETDFRDGLRLYLSKHAYKNTVSTDLWAAWEEASGKPIESFMHDWTHKEGYPIVHATIAGDTPSLKQERFYLNPSANKQIETWPIPLLASSALSTETFDTQALPLDAQQLGSELILNKGRAAFFRTAYDSTHITILADAVRAGKLNAVDRLGLLSDTFEAAKAGYIPTTDALSLLEAYRNEDNLVVWDIIASSIGSLRLVMNDDELRDNLKPYVRELTATQLDRLGWEERDDDTHFDKLLRPTIISLAAGADEPAVVEEALKRFSEMTKPEDIAPNLRGIIYGTAARKGGQAEFDRLWNLHNSTTNSEERVTLSAALTSFEHDDQIKLSLQKITSSDVRLQDTMYWIAYSFMNRYARTATWEWLKDNWQWLKENIGDDLGFYRMPVYVARVQSNREFLTEFTEFFNSKLSPAFERPINQGIETIEWQSAWRERDLAAVKAYFRN